MTAVVLQKLSSCVLNAGYNSLMQRPAVQYGFTEEGAAQSYHPGRLWVSFMSRVLRVL